MEKLKKIKRCKRFTLAIHELRSQRREFIFVFIILTLLFSASVSIVSLARDIPDEFTEYMLSTGECPIRIEAGMDRIASIEQMDLFVGSYGFPYLTSEAIGIPAEVEYTAEDAAGALCSFQGKLLRWQPDRYNLSVTWLNSSLLEGNGFDENSSSGKTIWLSDHAAHYLNKHAGDMIEFRFHTAEAAAVPCQIRGIYQQTANMAGYYVTLPLCTASLSSIDTITMFVVPKQISHFNNLKYQLDKICISVSGTDELISSMLLLIGALYAVAFFLLLASVGILLSTASNYMNRRRSFYAVCTALGLRPADMCRIIRVLMQCIAAGAFGAAMLIAPCISKYIVVFLEERFQHTQVQTNVWNISSLLIFVCGTLLLQICVTVSLRAVRRLSVSDLLREEEE